MRKYILIVFILVFTHLCYAQFEHHVKWNCHISESNEIVFQATIDNGWHLYDMNMPEGGPLPTVFKFETVEYARLEDKVTSKAKIASKYEDLFDMEVRWYDENPVFTQKISILDRKKFKIEGVIDYMICNDKQCMPDSEEFGFSAKDLPAAIKDVDKEPVNEVVEKVAVSKDSLKDFKDLEPFNFSKSDSIDYWKPVINELAAFGKAGSTNNHSWIYIFFAGFIGGLLALLTPCVWPVIPMTVSFFLKRSKSSRKKAVTDAIVYGLSIIVIYLVLGLLITAIFGASALNGLSTSAVFNLLFFALLVIFAISFFGAFELALPDSWTNEMDRKAEMTTGLVSIFFMAFTLVLVSFSCTGPIIGTLLVEAAGTGNMAGPAVGMFGFALSLALPFALFALFPAWLQNIPKSGGWLNSVKVVLGFLELALSLKFLSVADLAYGWEILDREVFLVLWIIIFALLGFYLLGKLRLPHDDELKTVSVPRLFLAILSLSFSIYLVPGLWGAPLKSVSAFSPPLYTQDFSLYSGEVRPKFHDYEEGMEYARRNGKPVMIDFSGYGCVNCREMEAAVWSDPRVKNIIENEYVLISLHVDDKTALKEPVIITEAGKQRKLRTAGDRWSYLQRLKFGANAQPFYVLLDNDGLPAAPWRAYNKNIDEYIRYLQQGLVEYKRRKAE
ncbi:MAG: thioredoxin family protein [Dysgonamonadaceae bacterium]|jgi:thiol:disulfide interchange protein DsbD|nr:thioredoxin family protein [Dysgonamonadaceae bacterium]